MHQVLERDLGLCGIDTSVSAHDALHEGLPRLLLLVCCLSAANEQSLRSPVLFEEGLHFGVPLCLRLGGLREAMRQQAAEQLGVLLGLGQEAEPDHPRQNQKELHVALLAHRGERRGHSLRSPDLRDEVADGIEQLLVLHVASAHLPTLLPVREPRHEARVVAEVGVDALQAVLDLPEVISHGLEGLHNVCGQDPRGNQPLGALPAVLRDVATPKRRHRVEEHLPGEIVAALAARVGYRIEMPDAANELLLCLSVDRRLHESLPTIALRLMDLLLDLRSHSLVLNRVHDEATGLLLDVYKLSNVLVLKAGPSEVQGDQGGAQLRARRALGPLGLPRSLAPTLENGTELPPSSLQSLCTPHGLGAELELVAIHPDGGVLLEARLQNVHTVVPRLVWEQCAIVDREVFSVRARRFVET
mmetsp:Transcript_55761/g.181068  ORF Transcript_55761/g.181068 Transcript_55761/m.181068 type:complete len:416 (-) Transcript_55761:278-1525(-)